MKKSKVLLLLLCTVALSMAAAFGTLAYLTDSEAVTNTFTVGQVHISLDETDVDASGVKDGDTRVKANTYHLIPGQTYTKECTVTVKDVQTGEVTEYRITGSQEANPMLYRLSDDSPFGRAVVGKAIGDTFTVVAPNGSYTMEVLNVTREG